MSRLTRLARFEIGGVSVQVRADVVPPKLRDLLARWLRFPPVRRRSARLRYDLLATPKQPRLVLNGYSYRTARRVEDLVDLLEYEVCYRVVALTRAVPLHAAALSWSGAGIVLAGPSGSGKSSLAHELLQRGLSYLSDEQVYLWSDGRVSGMPRAILLGEQMTHEPLTRAQVALGPVPVSLVVLLGVPRSEGAELLVAEPSLSLTSLIGVCLRTPSEQDLAALASLVGQARVCRLAHEGVAGAAQVLLEELGAGAFGQVAGSGGASAV